MLFRAQVLVQTRTLAEELDRSINSLSARTWSDPLLFIFAVLLFCLNYSKLRVQPLLSVCATPVELVFANFSDDGFTVG